jgi:amino-acid N-acetyltransferase
MVIDAATPCDLPAVRKLLEQQHLLLDGIDEHLQTLLVSREGSNVVGAAGLELYADGALLRSVAVDPALQGQRVGHQLVDAALQLAQRHGAPAVYLLTTTAADYFPRFGFEPVARADVPASVQASVAFRAACCASAAVMRRRLGVTNASTASKL